MIAPTALHERCHHRREKSPDVDAHIKDVIGAIFEVASLLVEVADHGRNIWFEETVADYQTGESGVDDPNRTKRKQQMACHKEKTADHDCLAISDLLIGYPATDKR